MSSRSLKASTGTGNHGGIPTAAYRAYAPSAKACRDHLLADPRTVNAFALPGGQIFITDALLRRLETEGQLAGVLGHEIGHVVARHSAQRMAKNPA